MNAYLNHARIARSDESPDYYTHEDRSDEYRDALRRCPPFVGDALGNADLTEVVAAYLEGNHQALADAIADAVDEWLAWNERTRPEQNDEDALLALCDLLGVAA